jgi:hypothetical protein
MPRPQIVWKFSIGLLLVIAVGCRKHATLDELVTQGEQLSGVRQSGHSRLREEFRAIELSRTLPRDLNSPPLEPARNAAAPLAELFEPRDLDAIAQDFETWVEELQADPLDSAVGERAAQLMVPWEIAIGRLEELSSRPGFQLGLRYERGRFGDFRKIALTKGAVQLLLVDSVRQQGRSLDEGMAQLARAWKWSEWLTQERYLEAWLTAAELRLVALAIVDRMASDPRATPADLKRLRNMLAASFESWPSVESALVRERAIDLHTYEAIRLGLVEMLFSTKERGELRVEGVLDKLKKMPPQRIDADEADYLAYMRRVIELARKPFFAAKDELVEADRLLGVHAGTDDYPWFAIRLCTENLTLAQAELASDRARVEAWVIALGEAVGQPSAAKINPRSGKSYEVVRDGNQIGVRLEDRKLRDPLVTIPTP